MRFDEELGQVDPVRRNNETARFVCVAGNERIDCRNEFVERIVGIERSFDK